eukprot:scaffold1373_cov367-Pinguiococcus_pyrenoidosus.AAC.2
MRSEKSVTCSTRDAPKLAISSPNARRSPDIPSRRSCISRLLPLGSSEASCWSFERGRTAKGWLRKVVFTASSLRSASSAVLSRSDTLENASTSDPLTDAMSSPNAPKSPAMASRISPKVGFGGSGEAGLIGGPGESIIPSSCGHAGGFIGVPCSSAKRWQVVWKRRKLRIVLRRREMPYPALAKRRTR